jgi:hypothetical protein
MRQGGGGHNNNNNEDNAQHSTAGRMGQDRTGQATKTTGAG